MLDGALAVDFLVSADSHFLDPPGLWDRWLPSKFHERAPRLVDDGDGGDAWLYAGADKPTPIGLHGLPGRAAANLKPTGVRYAEAQSGTYDGTARLADMDADGVAAEVIFPTSRPLSHFLDDSDRDFVLAGTEAYNAFVLEEFCGAAPSRLFAVAQLPTTGVDDCVRILQDAASEGFVAAVLPCWPSGGESVSSEDSRFWAAAAEVQIPICIHVSLRSREERLLMREYRVVKRHQKDERSDSLGDRNVVVLDEDLSIEGHRGLPNFGLAMGKAAATFSDLLLSGLFERYPKVRVGLLETWIGWIPRGLEAVDDIWSKNRYLANSPLQRPPSEYWKTNMVASFLDDKAGIEARHRIGTENILWSSDYPHFGTYWPNSRSVAAECMNGVSAADQAAILASNAVSFYSLGARIDSSQRYISGKSLAPPVE